MPGRVRIRVDACAENIELLERLSAFFSGQSGVREVRTSAVSGSVLLLYTGDLQSLLGRLQEAELVQLASPERQYAPMRRVLAALEGTNSEFAAETGGAMSLATLSFVALIGAGIVQASRGQFLPAGMTLFKYALSVMEREALRERLQTTP